MTEGSIVLNVVTPANSNTETALTGIIAAYKQQFAQESVMRVSRPVCVAF